MKRKMLSLLLVFAMLLSMMPTYAFAAEGTALDISAGAIEITENGEYTITGNSTTNGVKIAENVTATITLSNVSITLSNGSGVDGGGSSDMSGAGTAAIALDEGANVTLNLVGSNTLKGGAGRAAIEVIGEKNHIDGNTAEATPASLIIDGNGSLNATGGAAAAAIGASFCMDAGNITINGGTINATASGYSGAGIGGCHAGDKVNKAYGSFKSIAINGGAVNANGGVLGAGIGAGAHGSCDGATITITGGVIKATGGNYWADPGDDIGLAHGGKDKVAPEVTISDNAVVFASKINTKNSEYNETHTDISGGIVIQGNAGTLYDDVTLQDNLTIDSNVTLSVPDGKTLTVPEDVTLTVNGEINGEGTVKVEGGEVINEENITCTYIPGDYIMTLTAEPASQTYLEGVTLTATVMKYEDSSVATDVTGEVTFSSGETVLGSAELTEGVATLTTTLELPSGEHTVKASVKVDGIAVSGKTAITVNKAAQTMPPSAPAAAEGGIAYGSITLVPVTDEGQGIVEYAFVEKPAEGEAEAPSNWQESVELTGLKAGTTYIAYARFAGNEYYEPSAASEGTEITTLSMTEMTAPVLAVDGHEVSYKTVTLIAPAASEVYSEATVQYRVGTADEAGEVAWGEWQDSSKFSNLTPETAYQFQARYAIAAYGHYSEASNAVSLTTIVIPKLNVSLRIIGASKPSREPSFKINSYNYYGAEYQNWMKTTEYVVDAETTAEELITKVLTDEGYSFNRNLMFTVTSPEKFGPVHDLAATTYGSFSRWYLTVINGEDLEETDNYAYELKDGDQVIFHYVFNYTYETVSGWNNSRHPEIVQKYLQVLDLDQDELAAVAETIALINAIGRVTPDSEDAIDAARKAYDALNEDQKKAVSNYDTLTAAEETLRQIEEGSETREDLPTPTVTVKEDSIGLYSITLNPVTLEGVEDEQYVICYSASVDGENWGAWQTGNVFEKLLPAKQYYFRAMAQTADWASYNDSQPSAAVTASTLGGDAEAISVSTKEELSVALANAATDGTLTVVDITKDIVVNDIPGEIYMVDLPAGTNVVLTSSNASKFLLNEPGGNSCIGVTAGSTITVRNLELGAISGYGINHALVPGNEWQNVLRIRNASAVINLENVTMYNENGSGVIGDGFGGTVNIYSGALNAIQNGTLIKGNTASTINLIPIDNIMLEGSVTYATKLNVIPMLRQVVSGMQTSDQKDYTALKALEGPMSYSGGLRLNVDAEVNVPPVALTAPVAAAEDSEEAANADITYVIENEKITFTLKNAKAKEGNAIFQIGKDNGYMRAFTNDAEGIGVTYEFSGLTKDTEYTFTLRYNTLDNGYTDGTAIIKLTTTFTPEVLTAPVLGDQAEKTENSITLTAPDASTEDSTATFEYRISEDGETWGQWQDSTTFKNLKSGTTYYFQARYKAVHKYWLDSEASNTISITTKAAALAAPELSETVTATTTAITLTAPAASSEDAEATVQYRISEDGENWGDWQNEAKFTGLSANTTYFFQARYVASTNAWLDSLESESITAKTVVDEKSPAFVVEKVSGLAGEEVTVKVEMKNNPGVISVALDVNYDTDKLELVACEDAKLLPNSTFSKNYTAYPYFMSWEDSTAEENITVNGTLATLTFKIKADCAVGEEAEISVSYDPENIYDVDLDNVTFASVDGSVTVEAPVVDTEVNVSFRLIGDFAHGSEAHSEYVTWIPTTTYEVEKGTTAYDVVTRALKENSLDFKVNESWGYISSIQAPETLGDYWLGEYVNGKNSGWLYVCNDESPSVGMTKCVLQDGDAIVMYFVDNYATEEGKGIWDEVEDITPEEYMDKHQHKEVTVKGKDATCTADGLTDGSKCSVCGQTVKEQKVIKAPGHKGETVKGTAATCTKDGLTDGVKCSVCGETVKAQETIKASGHKGEVKNAKAATFHEDGYTGDKVCSVCSVTLSKGEVIKAECPSEEFADLAKYEEGSWYHDPMDYVIYHGIMNGTSTTAKIMEPNNQLTRAQLVQILYNMEGKPSVEGMSTPFTDVGEGKWYYNAIVWAYNQETRIVNGTSETTFDPDSNITREQLAAILYRCAGEPEVEGNLTGFDDAARVSKYAVDAMIWATTNGIIKGVTDTTLAPNPVKPEETIGLATRAQVATMITRYCLMAE